MLYSITNILNKVRSNIRSYVNPTSVYQNRDIWILILISVYYLYLALNTNFYQNDDWVYSENVKTMLKGSFDLHWYIGPTYFAQGLLGTFFSFFMGQDRLPLLTGIISILNLWLIKLYLTKNLIVSKTIQIFTILIIAFNPIFIYSAIGFMTEQYFIFILMLSLFLIDSFIKIQSPRTLFFLLCITFIGLLIRQVTLVIPLSLSLLFLYKKNYKYFALCFIWFGAFYYYHENIFPQTKRMLEIPLQFHHFYIKEYVIALVLGAVILITAFTFPFTFTFFKNAYTTIMPADISGKKYSAVLFLVVVITLSWILTTKFKPDVISWGEFPYFENTFERTGLYPRGIHGTKYQFIGNFKLYTYWDLASKIMGILLVSTIVLNIKSKTNYYLVFSVVYTMMLIATETFYDRYLLPLFVVFIFYLLSQNLKFNYLDKILMGLFATFITFYGYNLSMDFLITNKFAWSESNKITESGVDPMLIHGTNAWKLLNRNELRNYEYIVSYDSTKVNPKFGEQYTIYSKKEIDYPLNFYINPVIYVYKLNKESEALNQ